MCFVCAFVTGEIEGQSPRLRHLPCSQIWLQFSGLKKIAPRHKRTATADFNRGRKGGRAPILISYDFGAGVVSSCFLSVFDAGWSAAGMAVAFVSGLSLLDAIFESEKLLKDIEVPFMKGEQLYATIYYITLNIKIYNDSEYISLLVSI